MSFVEAFKEITPTVHFLADYCKPGIADMIEKRMPFDYTLEKSEVGINETMRMAYELAADLNDVVVFVECDYLWRPGIGKRYKEAIKELGLVSPYDHKNFYIDTIMHSPTCEVTLVNDYHYRSTERNTMTWGTHSSVVKKNLQMLKAHGYLDDEVWADLLIAGYQLYVPIPSFATHCVGAYLSPGINWEELWQKYRRLL